MCHCSFAYPTVFALAVCMKSLLQIVLLGCHFGQRSCLYLLNSIVECPTQSHRDSIGHINLQRLYLVLKKQVIPNV